MARIEELKQCLNGYESTGKIFSLWDFSELTSGAWFSDSFEFNFDPEQDGLRTYSEDKTFLSSIIEFAHADATGSTYGFWVRDKNIGLDSTPIVIFGSEGGYHIVARDINEFFQLLAFDSEPTVDWDEVYYFKDDSDFQPSEKNEEYKQWLKDVHGISEPMAPDQILTRAQSELQKEFHDWVGNYYSQ